jgi:hypothetical protein
MFWTYFSVSYVGLGLLLGLDGIVLRRYWQLLQSLPLNAHSSVISSFIGVWLAV